MYRTSWQRRLEEEEVEEVIRRSEWKVFMDCWEEEGTDADFTVESISV